MTLIIDNLTKGNRKNIESALIGGQLNAMVRHFIWLVSSSCFRINGPYYSIYRKCQN